MISRRIHANRSLRRSLHSLSGSIVALSLAATYTACGGGSPSQPAPGGHDGGTVSLDAGGKEGDSGVGQDAAPKSDAGNGAPSQTYPAFPVDVAQILANAGSVLSAPVIVTVTWSSDPDAATYDALGDAIGSSTYWKTINSEYGVGPATSGAADHYSITTAAPAGFSDTDLDNLVATNAGNPWPAATANTIYAVYLPPGTGLYLGGSPDAGGQDACSQGVGGYHTVTQTSNQYIYAIMPHCSSLTTADVENAASHELNEASTDPNPGSGYVGFDQNHLSFEIMDDFQDEVGDACEFYATASDATDFPPYTVQRQWSNKSATAGSQWCLPGLDEPFYNTTFLSNSNLDTISINLSSLGMTTGTSTSKGFKVPLNSSRTFPVGFFSDKATSGPWTIDTLFTLNLMDQSGAAVSNGTANVTFDKTSGVNGEISNVTVTPTAYNSLGFVFFSIRSTLSGSQQKHYLPILLSQN